VARLDQSTEHRIDRQPPAKVDAPSRAGQFAALPQSLGSPRIAGENTIDRQAIRLGDERLPTAQRHGMAAQIGRVQGNRHLQKVLGSLKRNRGFIRTTRVTPAKAKTGTAHVQEGTVNARGEKNGLLTSDVVPYRFVSGGKAGLGNLNGDDTLNEAARFPPPGRIDRRQMADEETGAGPTEGVPIGEQPKTAHLQEGEVNEWGEKDGLLASDVAPHVFVNGGKTGSDLDNTVGGRGGTGNQGVGSIHVVAPVYESADPPGALSGAVRGGLTGGLIGAVTGSVFGLVGSVVGGLLGGLLGGAIGAVRGSMARAWIRPGTGTARVTRSYTGSLVGANGPTLYMTPAAVTRTDVHEELHVNSSRAIHDAHIISLERRIAQHLGQANALLAGTTKAEAETALSTFINWNATIDAFRNADTAANTPMGTVDTADLASPTFIRDYGPRAVGGVNYARYFDTPPGPAAGGP